MRELIRSAIVNRLKGADPPLPFSLIQGVSNDYAIFVQGWPTPACFVWSGASKNVGDEFSSVIQADLQFIIDFALPLEKDTGDKSDSHSKADQLIKQLLHGFDPLADGNQLRWQFSEPFSGGLERNNAVWRMVFALRQYTAINVCP